jgi:hypothetical protein
MPTRATRIKQDLFPRFFNCHFFNLIFICMMDQRNHLCFYCNSQDWLKGLLNFTVAGAAQALRIHATFAAGGIWHHDLQIHQGYHPSRPVSRRPS